MAEATQGVIKCEAAVIYGHELLQGDVKELCVRLGLSSLPPVVLVVDPAEPGRRPVAFVTDQRLRVTVGDVSTATRPVIAPPAAPLVTHDERVVLDVAGRSLRVDGTQVELSRLEFDLLAHLMDNQGLAISRNELLERVWGYTTGATATVTVHIRQLRRKIEADPNAPAYLRTVRGFGYRFEM